MSQLLHSLLKSINLNVPNFLPNNKIQTINSDSRLIAPDSIFIGAPGYHVNGGNFWNSALSKGAIIALCTELTGSVSLSLKVKGDINESIGLLSSNFWQHPSRWMRLIGVTGTNGKTTVTHLVEHLSSVSGRSSALFGTLVNRWPGHSEIASNTTGFADQLQLQLAIAIESGVQIGAIEVSSHALQQHRITGCQFSGAIFTNLSQDHLDYHRSVEAYFESKASLFEPPLLSNKSPSAVINIDNNWGIKLAERLGSQCWRSSLINESADLMIKDIEYSKNSVCGMLITPLGQCKFYSPMIGSFNLMNLLQAVGVLLQQKEFSLPILVEALKTFRGVPGRMENISGILSNSSDVPSIIVDYAHTPDGLEKTILAVKPFVKKRLICIFGCGGNRDRTKRVLMGKIAAQLADQIIVTSDNPRNENPQEIIKDIIQEIPPGCAISVEKDRTIAIVSCLAAASSNDLILILGKGHENYQDIKNEKIYFDDQEEAEKSLSTRLNKPC